MLAKDVFSFSKKLGKLSKRGCFWGGRDGMKQMFELQNSVTVSQLRISNLFH